MYRYPGDTGAPPGVSLGDSSDRCTAAVRGYGMGRTRMPEIERLKDLSGSTELNPEMLEEFKAAFKEGWSEIVGPD